MILHVESRPGLYGDMEPVAFSLGGQRLGVLHIADRWLSADCSYYKVEAEDRSICILRLIHLQQEWELTLYQAPQLRTR